MLADKPKEETLKVQSSMLLSFQKTILSKEQQIRQLQEKIEELTLTVPQVLFTN